MNKVEKKVAYIMLFLLVIKTTLTYSNYIPMPNILSLGVEFMTYIFILIALVSIMKIKKEKLLLFLILSALTFFTGIITKNLVIFSSFLILCLAYFLDNDKIIKIIFSALFLVLIMHFIIYFFDYNFIGNVKMVVDHDEAARIRHYLGFHHPNISGVYTFWTFAAFAYLNRNKFSRILFAELLLLIVYRFNQSRTMIYCSLLILVLFLIIRMKIFNKAIRLLSKYIVILITAAILILIPMYRNQSNIAQKVDNISSGRIYHSNKALKIYGLSLFGQATNESEHEITMDVTYTALLYRYGIIYTLLLWLLTIHISKHDCEYEYAYIILWAVFAFFETYSLNLVVAFPLLFGSDWIGEKKRDDT